MKKRQQDMKNAAASFKNHGNDNVFKVFKYLCHTSIHTLYCYFYNTNIA